MTCFLLQLVSAETLRSMSDDIESLCLVREYRQLEETFVTHYTNKIMCDRDAVNLQDIKRDVHKRDKIVLEKRATADQSPAAVKIEERIGWECLWENALVCGERCMSKIQWLVKALYHRCNGEDCPHPYVTISEDVLNSMNSDLCVPLFSKFLPTSCTVPPLGVMR